MGIITKALVVALIAGIAHLLSAFEPDWSPVAFPFDPVSDRYEKIVMKQMKYHCKILSNDFQGAEDFVGHEDFVYTGLLNGDVIRFKWDVEPSDFKATKVFNTGGRPLGLRFGPDGTLWIADVFRGLLSWKNGKLTTHLEADAMLEGEPMRFIDAVSLSGDGNTVFVSDASTKYSLHDIRSDLWAGRPNGRIIKYDVRSGKPSVLVKDLYFANGIQLSSDEMSLFVAETYAGRVSKVDVHSGARSTLLGTHFTDNISPSERPGHFWLAQVAKHEPLLDTIAGSAFLRRLMRKLPLPTKPWAMGVLVNEQGEVLEGFEDPEGTLLKEPTSFAEFKNRFFVGTYRHNYIGVCE